MAFAIGVAGVVTGCGLGAGSASPSFIPPSPNVSESPEESHPADASATPSPASPGASPASPSASTGVSEVPPLQHVWVIVMENQGIERIVGAADAPTFNALIAQGGLATAYHGVGRPSQPNYLALFSGSTQGVTDNDVHDITAPTLADQLEAAGLSWRAAAENFPGDCFLGATATGGRDGKGDYARKHVPAISFTGISGDPTRCANVEDLTAFQPGAANVTFITPNMCHSMHDCSVADGDAWLKAFVPRITDSQEFKDGGVLFITFDEGDPGDTGGGRPATIVLSPKVAPGSVSDDPHDHYSLLRTIEDGFGLPCLGQACENDAMDEFFTRP